MTLIRNSNVKKLLQTISRISSPLWCPVIWSSPRIPGKVEVQNAAMDRLMKKQERYDTACEKRTNHYKRDFKEFVHKGHLDLAYGPHSFSVVRKSMVSFLR